MESFGKVMKSVIVLILLLTVHFNGLEVEGADTSTPCDPAKEATDKGKFNEFEGYSRTNLFHDKWQAIDLTVLCQ